MDSTLHRLVRAASTCFPLQGVQEKKGKEKKSIDQRELIPREAQSVYLGESASLPEKYSP